MRLFRNSGEGGLTVRRRLTACPTIALLALVAVAGIVFAQTASEKPSNDVRRVGARLQCKCGCKDSVATCSMLECESSKPAKLKIAQMQAVGMSDEQILQSFLREGWTYLSPPNAWG
jgi:cytochrome c-type biogenesis protein CcmH